MTKAKSKIKIIIPVCVAFIVAVACVVLFFFSSPKAPERVVMVNETQESCPFDESFTPFVTAGGNTLYVNEKTSAVAIVSGGEVVFNSHSDSAAKDKLASVISVVSRDKAGNAFVQNSTDNSVAFGGFEVSSNKQNDVTLTFNFIFDREGNIDFTIPVKFYGEGTAIVAEINTQNILLNEAYCIEEISILPGLFSERKPADKCFYTIPDGSGAQIDITAVSEKAYSQSLSVYGSDITFDKYSQGALLPCFSMTKNEAMLTSVITSGDALSSIYVKHNKNIGGSLYNTFTITPYGTVNGRLKKGASYDGIISLSYYLTEDTVNNYNTVAPIVRDCLTQKGYLPSVMSDKFVDFPFFITAIGSETGKKNSVYTTFENASEMIALLKSRGVRCMAFRYAGAGEYGLNTGASQVEKISSVLGGESGYNELLNVANEKNSTVWYDVNLSVDVAKNGSSRGSFYNDFRTYLAKEQAKTYTTPYDDCYDNISSAYNLVSAFEGGNTCINDLSQLLYTDIKGGVNRQMALEELRDKIPSLSVGGGLMLSRPAVYLMNSADAVFSLPQSATLEGNSGVTSVPLLQMVLHGTVCYGSDYINLNIDNTEAILKAVEFGACPSFLFTYKNCDVLDYGVYATQTAKFYSSVKRMLPLIDMKITSHEQVVSGVYKIVYDYSKVVYVNYNPSVVEVNGILVSAQDFVVI